MIKMEVEDYCDECLDFTPDVERSRVTGENFFGDEVVAYCETFIRCKNRNRCRAIVRYLKKKLENHENS